MERVEQIRECNACDWIGWADDCVHPKHMQSLLLCPECAETTECVTPERVIELRDMQEYQKREDNKVDEVTLQSNLVKSSVI